MNGTRMRVAIIGGGLAGTILMNALIKYPHLDVQLYEAKSEIQERGASVGLSANARRAMRLIGLGDVTEKAQGGEGPDKGVVIRDIDFDTVTVHRAMLLKELLAPIPHHSIHLSKRLSSIQETTIHFDDGTSADADIIIGADGVHSGVRKYVLGEGHPAIEPVHAGFWDTRNVIPFDEAAVRLGPSCINRKDPRQHMHVGERGLLFHDIIDDAQKVCIMVSGPLPKEWSESKSAWKYTVSREWLDERFQGFGDLGREGIDLLCGDKTEMPVYLQWESAEMPKLYNKTVCVIGDAAHAMAPWLGSGLAQAIEDSLILEKTLGRCTNIQEVPAAFEAFDSVRRTHARKVVDASRQTGELYFGEHKTNAKGIWDNMVHRDFVLDWDTEGAIEDSIDCFEQLRGSNGRH